MNPRYKGFNKYQPTCKDELLKAIAMMKGTLNSLMRKPEPDEGLLNNLLARVSKYESLLPQEKSISRGNSILFPEFNK